MRRLQLDEKIDLRLGPRLALRFYADCRPHVLQTARLHKGGILVCNGSELVEEGLGIGVPVCRYQDGTRFSLRADTFLEDSENPRLVRIYDMNGIASKRFRGSSIRRGSSPASLLKILEEGYRGLRKVRVGAAMIMDTLSLLGMRNDYMESRSRGQVAVTYHRSSKGVRIEANLGELSREGLQSIVFANEQGGSIFNEYEDSTGLRLHDTQIEAWRTIRAEWASLYSRLFVAGFRIIRPNGWHIIRGREAIKNRICWSGLDLFCDEFPQTLDYSVEIVGEGAA
jgi:hypothetical protein